MDKNTQNIIDSIDFDALVADALREEKEKKEKEKKNGAKDQKEKSGAKDQARAKDHTKNKTVSGSHNAQKTAGKTKDNKQTINENKTDINENTKDIKKDKSGGGDAGGVMSGDASGGLPFDFLQTIQSIIENFCINFNIENMCKGSQSQWSSACMLCGQYIKENNINIDKARSAEKGQKVFDIAIMDSLVDLWAYLCGAYKKTPLISDFLRFSAVSESWLYNYSGHKLTSDGGAIYKKVLKIQDFGVVSDLADGRKNPTGLIFFSKSKLGWNENGGGGISADDYAEKVNALPDLSILELPKL